MPKTRTISHKSGSGAPRVVFASDLHVDAGAPERLAAVLRLLAVCKAADRLYLLGDVFDLWLGDDDDRAPHGQVEAALAALGNAGCQVGFQRGNHDLLADQAFARRCGLELLGDEHRIDLGGTRTLLMHGDLLCTGDVEYLAFRAYAYTPATRAEFLALPLEVRLAKADELRQRSRSHTAAVAADIMDVTDAAVVDALQRHEASVLVHGHTHRPAVHHHAGGALTRYVLDAWHGEPKVLLHDGSGFERLGLDALEARLGGD